MKTLANRILLIGMLFLWTGTSQAEELSIILPLERIAYQTNERIDLAVLRTSAEALPAGNMLVSLTSEQNSSMTFTFPISAVPVAGNDARSTEHFHLNGFLLRPGDYVLTAQTEGAKSSAEIKIRTHIRKSPFKLIAWGSTAKGDQQQAMGEDSLGFNLMLGHARGDDSILGGIDWMQLCTQGGGFQMDLRKECDFSDPYVIRGASARISQAALSQRLTPNAIGVHFHDEPQLIRHVHPVTGQTTLHGVPAQVRSYEAAFGHEPIKYYDVDPNNSEDYRRWAQWCRWKLGFMEAYNTLGANALTTVRPDFLPVTQSQFAWSWCTFANGYYFNVDRGLPIVNGHGGYSHNWAGYFNPSLFLEMIRARNYSKPDWYLPTWFHMGPNQFRLEQYLSFVTNIQGMAAPPWPKFHVPSETPATPGLVESNKLMMRLGTVFTEMPVTRQPVALLHSLSQNIYAQTHNMNENRGGGHVDRLMIAYLAGKAIHNPFMTILDEDVVDGTLAANHKAVVLAGIDYLEEPVRKGLESFAASGGLVMITAESKIDLEGAVKLKAWAHHVSKTQMLQAQKEGKIKDVPNLDTIGWLMKSAEILGQDIEQHLDAAGIEPVFECDETGIVASRQAEGDIEYLFAVNASYDFDRGTWNAFKNTATTISVPDDGRPVYDAIMSESADEFRAQDGKLTASLRFGPGQMKVFARTARSIGSIRALPPVVHKDLTQNQSPLALKIAAVIEDDRGEVLTGSAPLEITVTDPLGVERYDLYRATNQGLYAESLPLAANDAPGQWAVTVRELLSGTEDTTKFTWQPASSCGAIAGEERRAVYFGNDREKIYRFFRTYREVTIVKGSEAHNDAAERLVEILGPWGVACKMVMAADVNEPRTLTEEEAKTWVGLQYAASSQIKPGNENSLQHVWFALKEPTILLGTPEDNPLIGFLSRNRFLPYHPQRGVFPGRGRGMLAWQRDGISPEQESITLIAYDKQGMAEAVGSLYEAMAGMNPLTQWKMPESNHIAAASHAPAEPPAAEEMWQKDYPDRIAGMKSLAGGRIAVLSEDGTLAALDKYGKTAWSVLIDNGGQRWAIDADRDGRLIAVGASRQVLAFDQNGTKQWEVLLPNMRTANDVAVSPDGRRIAVFDDHARVWAYDARGRELWSVYTGTGAEAAIINYTGDDADGAFAHTASGVFLGNDTIRVDFRDHMIMLKLTDDLQKESVDIQQPAEWKSLIFTSEGEVAGKVKSPGRILDAATMSEKIFLATEYDSAVACFERQDTDDLLDQPLWSSKAPGHIIKGFSTNERLLAVNYWGGMLRLYTATGKLVSEQAFEQDITAMEWADFGLVIGLANGVVSCVDPTE